MSTSDPELVALDDLLNKYSGTLSESYDSVTNFVTNNYGNLNQEWLGYLNNYSNFQIEVGGSLVIGSYFLVTAVLSKIIFELKGGFAGDLSPADAVDMLENEKDCVLVDVRPAALRSATGKPALRRKARGKYVVVQGTPMVGLEERRALRLGAMSGLGLRTAAAQVLQLRRISGKVKIILIDQKGRANKLARLVAREHRGDVYQVKGGFSQWERVMRAEPSLPGIVSTVFFRRPALKED